MHSADADSFVKAVLIRVSFESRPKIRLEKKQAGGGWKRFVSKSDGSYFIVNPSVPDARNWSTLNFEERLHETERS